MGYDQVYIAYQIRTFGFGFSVSGLRVKAFGAESGLRLRELWVKVV